MMTDQEISLARMEIDLRLVEKIDTALAALRFKGGRINNAYPYEARYMAIHASIRAQVLGLMSFLDADIVDWKILVDEDVTEFGPLFTEDENEKV